MSLDLQAFVESTPFQKELDMRIERAEGGVRVRASLGPAYEVSRGAAHGGIVATVLDTAITFALIAQDDQDWVTVDLRVDYLRPTLLGDVTAWAEVVRAGRSIGRARGELRDAEGRLCATAIGTFAPTGPAEIPGVS